MLRYQMTLKILIGVYLVVGVLLLALGVGGEDYLKLKKPNT